MFSLAFCLVLAQPQTDPPVYGWRDAGGVSVQVRRFERAEIAAIHIIASAESAPETERTHGWRHLLEHLLVRGKDRRLDIRLEAKGAILTADTYRDFTHVRIVGPPSQAELLVSAMREVLGPLNTDQSDIARECEILAEEEALNGDLVRFGAELWRMAYGSEGLDPNGNLEVMRTATPDGLELLRRKMFRGESLAIVVCVPNDVSGWAARLREIDWPDGDKPSRPQNRVALGPDRRQVDGAFGEFRAVGVGAMGSSDTLATLAAAFGLATKAEGPVVSYVPTALPGLITLGETRRNNGIGALVDEIGVKGARELYASGIVLAQNWVQNNLQDPVKAGLWYGVASCYRYSEPLENLPEKIGRISESEFVTALRKFEAKSAYVAVGVDR